MLLMPVRVAFARGSGYGPRCSAQWLLALLAAETLGCGAFQGPLTCPEHGGPAWVEIASPHFTLKTDLPESVARGRLDEFEESFQLLSERAFPSKDPPSIRS